MLLRFFGKIVVFALCLILVGIAIAQVKITDEFLINKTHDTGYDKIAWNLNMINNHPVEIKDALIFLGPSLVQGGICDSTLQANGIRAFNFGVNHPGKEMEFFFVKRLAKLQPKCIYLAGNDEARELHPMTPLLFSPAELVAAGQNINVVFGSYFIRRINFVLDFMFWRLAADPEPVVYPKYGILYQKKVLAPDSFQLIFNKSIPKDSSKLMTQKKSFMFLRKLNTARIVTYNKYERGLFANAKAQHAFFNDCLSEGAKNKIEMASIYMPLISDLVGQKDKPAVFYYPNSTFVVNRFGNYNFINNPLYWTDFHHLSKTGAIRFTQALIDNNYFVKYQYKIKAVQPS